VDRRVKGFRPPQSRAAAEWSDDNLVYRNFEWCATAARQSGVDRPAVRNRLVKIPIHLDDFPLYKPGTPYSEWERRAIAAVERGAFVAIGLHDCYADLWLPHYAGFLETLRGLGAFKTLDDVANETILASAV
jgi:hypothetical protein